MERTEEPTSRSFLKQGSVTVSAVFAALTCAYMNTCIYMRIFVSIGMLTDRSTILGGMCKKDQSL